MIGTTTFYGIVRDVPFFYDLSFAMSRDLFDRKTHLKNNNLKTFYVSGFDQPGTETLNKIRCSRLFSIRNTFTIERVNLPYEKMDILGFANMNFDKKFEYFKNG